MMYERSQPRSRIVRGLYTICAASFLFFLSYSAPHRVHHFFDEVQPASHAGADDHHDKTDQQNKAPSASDCVFQASANRCAFWLTAQTQPLSQILLVQGTVVFHDTTNQHQFLASAFHIRAPPKA
jgi:hypothetical protein